MRAPEQHIPPPFGPQAKGAKPAKAHFFAAGLARSIRTTGKGLLLIVFGLLACAALLRTVVALLEAAALLALALGVASLALPRGLGWYWKEAQDQIPRWLQQVVDSLVQTRPDTHKIP